MFTLPEPLAARCARALWRNVGQEHLLAPGRPLGDAVGVVISAAASSRASSSKTTIARLIAQYTDREFVEFSAVMGDSRVRKSSKAFTPSLGRGTVLFCDEIHRFNRAQQDAFLPTSARDRHPDWRHH
jgi:putative ATPase